MEPTKEIIELSRKIHDLGHIGSVKWGDWFFLQNSLVLCAYATRGFHEWAEAAEDVEHFPIISLEDGLLWLREHNKFRSSLWGNRIDQEWYCGLGDKSHEIFEGTTPHEAVLKAMVKVLEEKG